MIKKTIKYEDLEGNEVSDDFYFSLTKLEMVEKEIEYGGISETLEKLFETSDAKKAYALFKNLVLATVGKKHEDGKRFIKNDDVRSEFADSNAMSEMIIGFLQDPDEASQWLEGALPASLVAEVKEKTGAKELKDVQLPPDKEEPAQELQVTAEPAKEHTRDELLAMTDEEFDAIAGTEPMNMKREHLVVAMQRKNAKKMGQ